MNGLNVTHKAWKLSYKYRRLRRLWTRLEVDLINLIETKINPSLLSRVSDFKDNLFRSSIHHTIFANNSNEHLGVRQQGGVLSSARGDIASFCVGSGADPLKLGRWTWIDLQFPLKKVRMITAYNCVKSRSAGGHKTVYAQQRRFFLQAGRDTCPRKAFCEDLCGFISSSINDKFSIVVALDANENMQIGKIARSFRGLGLVDSITSITSNTPPGTHIRGSKQIDGIWTSSDVSVSACSFCPFNFGVGDHRIILVDLVKDNLFGAVPSNPYRPKMRRLISSNSASVDSYLSYTKEKIKLHKIIPKLNKLINESPPSHPERSATILNQLDDQLHQIFTSAEKQCRKIRCGQVDFSPELSKLGLTWQFWRKALHYKQGRFKGRNFLISTAKRLQISSFNLSPATILFNLRSAKRDYVSLKRSHQTARDKYVSEDSERTIELKRLRSKEKLKLKWKMYKKYFGKRRMNSISQVEYFSGSSLVRVSNQFAIEKAIMTENSSRFILAYSSPLTNQPLLGRLGMCGENTDAQRLLHESASIEAGELSQILSLFHKINDLQIPSAVSPNDWISHWKSATEATESSISGLHFGHYKVQATDPTLAAIRCAIINLCIRNGIPLQRWLRGLSVMLEKSPGKILVEKLRATLLLEADFNALHKIVFNGRILPTLEKNNMIPSEIIGGRKSQSALHVALNKKLIADISNQIKSPSIVMSADATNCYDRVAHPFASLTAQHFGVQLSYVRVLLTAIQQMNMFLRTSFGISSSCYSGSFALPFQGAIQGNGAAPVLWLIISIILVRYLYALNLVTEHHTPISGALFSLAALVYVDDSDLNILNLNQKSTVEVLEEAQALLNAWHFALRTSGGELKLEKCFWTLQDYVWTRDK